MAESFIRLPPDGAGKGLHTREVSEITYNNLVSAFILGEIITGNSSGSTGTLVGQNKVTSTTGSIFLENITGSFSVEVLNGPGVVNRATATSTPVSLHEQKFQLVDSKDPTKGLSIDVEGAAKVRFDAGSPEFDAFGRTKVAELHPLGDYIFKYNKLGDLFSETLAGTSSVNHNIDDSSITLSAGTGASDRVVYTSHKYHVYHPAQAHEVSMTVVIGDTGKTNVIRRWGYFDDDNGLFYELNNNIINVVLRSSVTGSVVDTQIPQSAWSRDTLNGNGPSKFNLDIQKNNLYDIDFQWLGAGRVHFYVTNEKGIKIIAHVLENANIGTRAFMQSGTLPVRWEIVNNGVSASTSEMKVTCASVKTSGQFNPIKSTFSQDSGTAVTGINTIVPVISFRSKTTLNTITNRISGLFKSLFTYVETGGAVKVELIKNPGTLTTPVWNSVDDRSGFEVDISSTVVAVGTGEIIFKTFVQVGVTEKDLNKELNYWTEYMRLNADGVTQNIYTFTATKLGGANTDVIYSVTWDEI